MPNKLEITTPTDREIVITRSFDAPRNLVWDAHTRPELVRRWLLGPPGWEMPVCDIDLRVGGKYRYEWVDKGRGKTMGMGGVFTEVVKPEIIGSKEKFDDDWTGGETVNTQVFAQKGGDLSDSLVRPGHDVAVAHAHAEPRPTEPSRAR